MSAGERKNQRESHLDPWALQNECSAAEGILILRVSLRWVWGPEGQGSVTWGYIPDHASRMGDSGQVPVLSSVSEATHPTLSDADWRALVALQTPSFGGDRIGGTAAVNLLSWQKVSGGDQAMELNSSFISNSISPCAGALLKLLVRLMLSVFFQWVWGRSHSFPIQYTEHSALSYKVFCKGCMCPKSWISTLLTCQIK